MSYAAQRALALRLIKKKGAFITIKRKLEQEIGPNDTPIGPSELTYTCWAIIAPNLGTLGSSFDASFKNNEFVIVRSKQLIIAGASLPDGVEPLPGDIAKLPNREYIIGAVAAQSPDGGPAIVYTCPVKT